MKALTIGALGFLLIAQGAPPVGTVADLAWMSGRWVSEADGRWTEEVWAPPRGGAMLGFSRSGRGGEMREFEFLRLAPGESGTPTYFAQPGGRPAVAFRLVAHDATSATFENPGHDYPQRIRYRRFGRSMTATISSIDGSGERSWNFNRR
ncbi:MAG: DUF6265 family protein [Sphingomonas sp.]